MFCDPADPAALPFSIGRYIDSSSANTTILDLINSDYQETTPPAPLDAAIQSDPIFPKVSQIVPQRTFYTKILFVKIAQNVAKYLGYFGLKLLNEFEPLKINPIADVC